MTDYKLVPFEPTPEMVEAYQKASSWTAPFQTRGYKAMLRAAPAVQGEPSLVAWALYDATADQKYMKMRIDGSLAIFDSEAAARRAKFLHPGTDYKRCEYYDALQPAEQQPCPEGVREGAPYDNPAFESLCREHETWGTAAAAQCAVFWEAGKRVAEQKPAPDVAGLIGALEARRDDLRWMNLRHDYQNQALGEADALNTVPQPAEQQTDVTQLVEALEEIRGLPSVRQDEAAFIAESALAAHRKGGEA